MKNNRRIALAAASGARRFRSRRTARYAERTIPSAPSSDRAWIMHLNAGDGVLRPFTVVDLECSHRVLLSGIVSG